MTNTITNNAYRMLVLAGIALLVLAFMPQSEAQTTKNPMDCLVHADIGDGEHRLTNICDETLNVEIYYEERFNKSNRVLHGGDSTDITFAAWNDERGIRWAACFDGESPDGPEYDGYFNTDPYSCVPY